MSRRTFACFTLLALSLPSAAYADDTAPMLSVPPVSLVASLIGLTVAVVLLLEALAVRRAAHGGVIAEKISYVVLAVVCLAASALAQWVRNFVDGITLDQVQFASQVLVVIAMSLLAAYFGSVRRGLQGLLRSMSAPAESAEAEGAERG